MNQLVDIQLAQTRKTPCSYVTFNTQGPPFLSHYATGTLPCPTTRPPTVAPSATLSQFCSSWMMPRCRWRSCSMSGRSSWTSSCSCASLSSIPLRYRWGGRRSWRALGGLQRGLLPGQGCCPRDGEGNARQQNKGIRENGALRIHF